MKITESIRDENDGDRRHNMLKAAASQLQEHFDSVIVIGTAQGPGTDGTYLQFASRGNTYANVAAAERWITNMKSEWASQRPTGDD